MFGRGICEKYQSRDEQFPEPKKYGKQRYSLIVLDYQFTYLSSTKQKAKSKNLLFGFH